MEIWTPKGTYYVEDHPDLIRMTKTVQLYDPNLSVGMNRQTGDICLFVKNEEAFRGLKPLYGWQRMPTDDEVLRRLYMTDTHRHGDKILEDAWKAGDKEKERLQEPIREAAGEAAERMEFELRER